MSPIKELKRRFYDLKNDKHSRLNDCDLAMINGIRKCKCANKMYATGINRIRPKNRFTLFKSDYRQVLRYVDAIWSTLRVDTFFQKLQIC